MAADGLHTEHGSSSDLGRFHEWRPDQEWMWDEPVGWSRVGDWIWKHLCADENPAEIKRRLALYVDELHTRSLNG